MKHLLPLTCALLLASACQGPQADDAAICNDVIRRVCSSPLCDGLNERLALGGNGCVDVVTARAGCNAEGFAWGDNDRPSRDRVLECRLPLIRSGDSVTNAPACTDIDEMFDRCADIERLLGTDGGTQ